MTQPLHGRHARPRQGRNLGARSAWRAAPVWPLTRSASRSCPLGARAAGDPVQGSGQPLRTRDGPEPKLVVEFGASLSFSTLHLASATLARRRRRHSRCACQPKRRQRCRGVSSTTTQSAGSTPIEAAAPKSLIARGQQSVDRGSAEPSRGSWRPDRLRGLGDDKQGQEVSGRGS